MSVAQRSGRSRDGKEDVLARWRFVGLQAGNGQGSEVKQGVDEVVAGCGTYATIAQ